MVKVPIVEDETGARKILIAIVGKLGRRTLEVFYWPRALDAFTATLAMSVAPWPARSPPRWTESS